MGKHRKKTRRDAAEIARGVVEQAIGEKLSGEPLRAEHGPPPKNTRDPAAVAVFFMFYNYCRVHSTLKPPRRWRRGWRITLGP
jgi:hypothetical protein